MKHASSLRLAPLLAALVPAIVACSSTDPMTTPDGGGGTGGKASTGNTGPLGDRPDLPVDEQLSIQNLTGKVDVVRDKYGRPHIYATNVNDLLRVEGYLVAVDRTMQLEFYRRYSEGRLAEILSNTSASAIDSDIAFRHIGLARTAKAQWDALPDGEVRDGMLAYADGVTQAYQKIRSGELHLPTGLIGIEPDMFTDWTPVDSLAIGRLQTYLLSYDADADLVTQSFFDAARNTFTAADPDPAIAARAGIERDLVRFAPADPATTTKGYPMLPSKPHTPHPQAASKPAPRNKHNGALAAASGYLDAMKSVRRVFTRTGFGSNNWAVSAQRSATGHAMVASDPHLSLSAPSVFWPVSMEVKAKTGGDASHDIVVAGLAFPGIPAIILGHNEHIAWGATVAGYDVSDAYAETLTPDGKAVVYQGQNVQLQTIEEVINVQSGTPVTYPVQIVPHHGPLVPIINNHKVIPPNPQDGAISIRWTGMEATREIEAVFGLLRAKDVDTAREELKKFGVGAQNWMIGDTSGHILWTSHANVPIRDTRAFKWDAQKYTGTLPCLVLPGDGTSEWTGYLDDDLVPWTKDPAAGYISTANNDPIGNTLDNDPSNDQLPDGTPMYLACTYDIGFREGKIQARLESHSAPLKPEDLSAIQGDEESSMGKLLAPALLDAIDRGQEEKATPGKHPDLATVVADAGWDTAKMKSIRDLLAAWGQTGNYAASSGVNPDDNKPLPASGETATEVANSQATLVFNAWLVRLMNRTFGDELSKMGIGVDHQQRARAILRLVKADPATLATYNATTGDSAIWDDLGTTGVVESRHDRMLRALLDALADLAKTDGADISTYRWGAHHTVTFTALLPFWNTLSIPPANDPVFGVTGFPRHGDSFSIDASEYSFVGSGQPFDFTYDAGPTQRFVIDLDPAGPKAVNALPGGVVWNATSPHFRDEAELWRRNLTHPVPFALDEVVAAKEKRTVFSTP
ncbi:MAG: penicillin acylase family protein [Minicystis sp.]